MTDKELIKQEIERRKSLADKQKNNGYFFARSDAYMELLNFIDSIPEESGCEVNFTTKNEDLEEALFGEFKKIDHECFEKGIVGFEREKLIARHFAEWQKQQMKEALQTEYEKGRFDMKEEMMKDAIECIVEDWCGNSPEITIPLNSQDFKNGDRVKIIIIKPE